MEKTGLANSSKRHDVVHIKQRVNTWSFRIMCDKSRTQYATKADAEVNVTASLYRATCRECAKKYYFHWLARGYHNKIEHLLARFRLTILECEAAR